jgi:hypothetical protein
MPNDTEAISACAGESASRRHDSIDVLHRFRVCVGLQGR